MRMRMAAVPAALVAAVLAGACGTDGDTTDGAAVAGDAAAAPAAAAPQEIWWERLQELCGQAFAGEMVRYDPALDTAWLNRPVIMHVRECSADEVRIPLHVGENRSRTWILTRTAEGIRLKHDHRHPDGTEEVSTMYGGTTTAAGTEARQEFPAGEYSRNLFLRNDHPDGVYNVWAMEVHPGERFTYQLTRPNRNFGADFDLTQPVAAPPAPWVVEPRR
jgi:hypothetical protein